MITEESVVAAGKLFKPHSYKGELNIDIFYDKSIYENPKTPFFIKIDNILVPFFVERIGGGSSRSSFIKFKNVDSDSDASILANKELYILKSTLASLLNVKEEELEVPIDEYLGFKVIDMDTGDLLGEVVDFEEGREYDYMIIKRTDNDETLSIPFIEEFVSLLRETKGDAKGEFGVNLPEGFLEINS